MAILRCRLVRLLKSLEKEEIDGNIKDQKAKLDYELSAEAFELLLSAFDPDDRERAGTEYQKSRLRLARFFEWRGVHCPDDLADDTLNRTARKLLDGLRILNLSNFIGGVARNVLLEYFDQSARDRKKLADYVATDVYSHPDDDDQGVKCFRECLDGLPSGQSELLEDYYNRTDVPRIKQRKELSARMGESANALRIRVHRIRQELDRCIQGCLERVK